MLPPGLEVCPSCGARLKQSKSGIASLEAAGQKPEVEGRDIFWLSAYILGIALIPILIAIAIGILCIWLGGR